MASKPISELTPITYEEIVSTDSFVLEHSGTARRLTEQQLVRWLTNKADGHGGVISIAKTGTSGLIDTYTVSLADETSYTFTVTNGAKGDPGTPGTTGATGSPATYEGTTVRFAKSNNGTAHPTTGWEINPPEASNGEYLWTKADIQFNSGTSTIYSVAKTGVNGTGNGSVQSIVGNEGISSVGNIDSSEFTIGHSNSVTASTSKSIKKVSFDSNGHITDADNATLGVDYGAKSFTVAIPQSGWSSNGVQTVSNANFVSTGYCYMVSPDTSSFMNYGKFSVRAGNVTTDGQITFYAKNVPSVDLTVNVVRVVGA